MNRFIPDKLETRYAANDSPLKETSPTERAIRARVRKSIDNLLTEFEDAGIETHLVRDYWSDALIRRLLKANPFREPVQIVELRQDAMFCCDFRIRLATLYKYHDKAIDKYWQSLKDSGEV